jgi:hypothetical protein
LRAARAAAAPDRCPPKRLARMAGA